MGRPWAPSPRRQGRRLWGRDETGEESRRGGADLAKGLMLSLLFILENTGASNSLVSLPPAPEEEESRFKPDGLPTEERLVWLGLPLMVVTAMGFFTAVGEPVEMVRLDLEVLRVLVTALSLSLSFSSRWTEMGWFYGRSENGLREAEWKRRVPARSGRQQRPCGRANLGERGCPSEGPRRAWTRRGQQLSRRQRPSRAAPHAAGAPRGQRGPRRARRPPLW